METTFTEKKHTFCCQNLESLRITDKIRFWISDRQIEGWTVEFSVRIDGGKVGIIWQCVKHPTIKGEFSPCIDMYGDESLRN